MLPFSREVYFSLFGEMNIRYGWAQALGMLFVAAICLGGPGWIRLAPRSLLGGLALLWAGSAGLWYFKIFAPINFLAPLYGYLAFGQALLLFGFAALAGDLQRTAKHSIPGLLCFLLALAFPLADAFTGLGWPHVRWPALNGEPLLLITMGLLLHLRVRGRIALACLPWLLAGVAGYTAWVLSLHYDWVVLGAVFIATVLCFVRPGKALMEPDV